MWRLNSQPAFIWLTPLHFQHTKKCSRLTSKLQPCAISELQLIITIVFKTVFNFNQNLIGRVLLISEGCSSFLPFYFHPPVFPLIPPHPYIFILSWFLCSIHPPPFLFFIFLPSISFLSSSILSLVISSTDIHASFRSYFHFCLSFKFYNWYLLFRAPRRRVTVINWVWVLFI